MTFRGHYEYVNCCWLSVQDQVNTFSPFSYVLWLTLMNSPCKELGIRVGPCCPNYFINKQIFFKFNSIINLLN